MSTIGFRAQVAILALGWMMVIAWITGPGVDSDALWVLYFYPMLTLSLVMIRGVPARSPGDERRPPGPPARAEKLVESKAGMVVVVLLSLILTVGSGAVLSVILFVPVKGIAATIEVLPEILGSAIVGAAMSMIGFGLFALVLSLLGPILSAVYEAWTGYIAPVIGGIAGAALGSGYVTGGIPIVGLAALVGGLALLIFRASTAEKRVRIKDVGDYLTAGIGFGIINGIILAALFKVLDLLK